MEENISYDGNERIGMFFYYFLMKPILFLKRTSKYGSGLKALQWFSFLLVYVDNVRTFIVVLS